MKRNFVRRTIKKMAAIGTGVAMVGATLTGALAQDLGDYPEPFVVDGVYDDSNAFVVGDNALAIDTIGLGLIQSNLQFESKVAVSTGGSTVSVEGGKTEQVPLGKGLSNATFFDTTLQDDDVAHFFDGEVTYQSKAYDTSEELQLSTQTDPLVTTSLISSEDDYESGIYLEMTARDTVRFAYKFDESINLSKASTNDPLRIDFMGHSLQITSVAHGSDTNAGTSFTAYVGEEHYLSVGSAVVVEGKTVTLEDAGSASVVVDVDGVVDIVNVGATQTVNGIEVTVDSSFSRTDKVDSAANLILGTQSSETYVDADEFIGEDEDDPDWVWDLAGLQTQGTAQTFRIENDYTLDSLDDNPPMAGECIDLPNDYVSICFDSLTVAEDDYATYTFEFESSGDLADAQVAGAKLTTNTSVPLVYLHTTADEGLELLQYTAGDQAKPSPNVTSTKRTSDVWLYSPGIGILGNGSVEGGANSARWAGVFYKDDGTNKVTYFGSVNLNATTEILRVNYGNTKDTNIVLKPNTNANSTAYLNLTLDIAGDSTTELNDAVDDIDMLWGLTAATASAKFKSLGATLSTEEATEIQWGAANQNLGTKDEDHRTYYGIIIKNPKSQGASDQIQLSVPQDQVMANIVISGSSATVTSGGTAFVTADITPVSLFASEVSTPSDFNLILVGGPCANTLVDDLFDVTCEGWPLESGQAMLRSAANGDKVAVLVAGTTGDDTERAAGVLANWADEGLTGTEVIVSGTSDTDVNVDTTETVEETAEETVEETA